MRGERANATEETTERLGNTISRKNTEEQQMRRKENIFQEREGRDALRIEINKKPSTSLQLPKAPLEVVAVLPNCALVSALVDERAEAAQRLDPVHTAN